jgi:type II secretory pathway pseudopilin PulG
MYRGFKLRNYRITKLQNRSRGYILITLMLFLSLLAIAALAVLPDLVFQTQRDREEELIHRGVSYARAIRRYYRKLGRYPTKIEDLENTNQLRFLRKRYKDPFTGKDFKILRLGDVALGSGLMLGQPGAGLQGQPAGLGASGSGFQSRNALTSGSTGQKTQAAKTENTDSGSNSGDLDTSSEPADSSSSSSGESDSSEGQVFGGGPILGVVSTKKGKTVREFCNKSNYKDWYFIYDPTTDRGGMMKTPWCPGQMIQGVNPVAPPPPNLPPSPPNTGAPGTVSPTPNPPNPGAADMPPEQ